MQQRGGGGRDQKHNNRELLTVATYSYSTSSSSSFSSLIIIIIYICDGEDIKTMIIKNYSKWPHPILSQYYSLLHLLSTAIHHWPAICEKDATKKLFYILILTRSFSKATPHLSPPYFAFKRSRRAKIFAVGPQIIGETTQRKSWQAARLRPFDKFSLEIISTKTQRKPFPGDLLTNPV